MAADRLSTDTRQSVLESACGVFAEKGFRDATVAEICEAADANVAAVNYYFGHKEDLYREVWRHAQAIMDQAYPESPPDTKDAETWLREHIRNRLRAVFDPGPAGWFPRILQKEMAVPSELLDDLRATFLQPRLERLEQVVRRLLGDDADRARVTCCALNIVGLYAFFNLGLLSRRRLFQDGNPSKEQLNKVIEQIQQFAIAAVAGLQRPAAGGAR